jgi:TonB family protein
MLDSALKASAIVAIALVANWCLRSRSAALRHLVLSAAIVSAAAMPAAAWLVPALDIPLVRIVSVHEVQPQPRVSFSESSASSSAVANAAHAQESATPRQTAPGGLVPAMLTWAIRVWIVGAGVGFLVLFVGLGRLSRLAAKAEPLHNARWRAAADAIALEYGLRRPVRLLAGTGPTLLVTWGYRRPIVLVPAFVASWPLERVQVVLRHELAHIQRRDWLVLMTAELLRVFHWFNPLMWIASRHLRLESERACDDVVLQHGVEGRAYATQLLDIARSFGRHRGVWLPAPAMARATSLERRIAAMLNPALNRGPLTNRVRIATIAAASLLTASLAGFGASAQTFGTVSGSVVDATSRPISGATLVLTGAPNQAKQELRSDASGHFEFVGLPVGEYRLEAFTAGFRPYRAEIVVGSRPAQQLVTLQVGNLMETITVSGVSVGPRRELVEPTLPDSSGCVATAEGGKIAQPIKLRDVRAAYPPLLYETKIDGKVTLEARIGTDGAPREVRVVAPAQHPDFDAAAVDAVRQWRFSPTLLNCVPVEVSMTVYVNFVPRL